MGIRIVRNGNFFGYTIDVEYSDNSPNLAMLEKDCVKMDKFIDNRIAVFRKKFETKKAAIKKYKKT